MPSPRSEHEQLTAGLISPRRGPGVCARCLDLIAGSRALCANCERLPNHIDAFVPIAYSIGGEPLHHDIAAYKRGADASVPAAGARMRGLLGQFIAAHEQCLARAAGSHFDVVTTVPSGSARPARDRQHPLRDLVAASPQLQGRYRRVLYPGLHRGRERVYDPYRYFAFGDLSDASVLLIDDLWTTGASAQSAAAALRACGAAKIAVITVGRHLNRGWSDNDLRLRRLQDRFSWATCTLCVAASKEKAPSPAGDGAFEPAG